MQFDLIKIKAFISTAGADPGFLERRFICIRVWVFALLILSFFFNVPWKWNNLVSLRPNYFIFIGYLKRGEGRVFKRTLEPTYDPPLYWHTSRMEYPNSPRVLYPPTRHDQMRCCRMRILIGVCTICHHKCRIQESKYFYSQSIISMFYLMDEKQCGSWQTGFIFWGYTTF